MNKSEVFEFLSANPVFHLATIEGDKPRVRGMLLYRADEDGIIFHTGKMKDLHRQLTENNLVEMSFNNNGMENLTQVRVSGRAELVEDMELKKEIVQNRDFLQAYVKEYGYEPLAVYCIKNGVASVWTWKTNLDPKTYVEL